MIVTNSVVTFSYFASQLFVTAMKLPSALTEKPARLFDRTSTFSQSKSFSFSPLSRLKP